MKPDHDEPSEVEAPMTRALMATDIDDPTGHTARDPDGTVGAETYHSPSETDVELPKMFSSVPMPGSISAWSSGGIVEPGGAGKIEPGQVLYSKYMVLRKLGSGAMGEVWLVRHVTLKSEHALKVIIPNFASNRVALMRFQRELEVMATLRQEHAVSIFDAFIDEDGGYIDMEYLDGETIHDVLQAVRKRADHDPTQPLMPLDWIVRILDQLCEVLQVAHGKGIVHRDLKPSNMMLLNGRKPGRECLKVLDFGIAKIRDDPESAAGRNKDEEEANKTQGFIGTPSYASPEQAMVSDDVDGRSDLYSFGIMLYEFVTGRLPFRGNQWQVMSQNATAPPPSFAEANPRLRPLPELEHAILRILSKSPDGRPQTAGILFDEIREAIEAVLPAGSPGLTPATWDAIPFYSLPSGTGSGTSNPSLFPTERESQFGKGAVSTQAATLVAQSTSATPVKSPLSSPSDLGVSVAVEPPKSPVWIAALVGVLVLLSAVVVAGLFAFSKKGNSGESDHSGGTVPKTAEGTKEGRKGLTFADYWPSTCLPVGNPSADEIWPEKVRRTADETIFIRFADGIYLPAGYKIENPTDLDRDGWPRIISRDGARFIRIRGGEEWTMGDPDAQPDDQRTDAPAHRVTLSGYYIQEFEVTNGQFEAFLDANEIVKPGEWVRAYVELRNLMDDKDARRHPAVYVSHKMAETFAKSRSGLLPTEAQWEFAAKSRGANQKYVWGDKAPNSKLANVDVLDAKTTAPVGSYKDDKTEQGIFDMTGNVQEMCRDVWEPYKKTLTAVLDPCGESHSPDAIEYAIRGGNFHSYGAACSTTRRDDHRPANEVAGDIGFRLVVEAPDTRKPLSKP